MKLRVLNEDKYVKMKPKFESKNKSPFKLNDQVRILVEKTAFHRNYLQNYSEEIFFVSKILRNLPINLYVLRDFNGDELQGRFYAREMTKISPNM